MQSILSFTGRVLNRGNWTVFPVPEWVITRFNDVGEAECRQFSHVIDVRPFSLNLPPLHEPANDYDDEDFILNLDDNENSFRDWLSSIWTKGEIIVL